MSFAYTDTSGSPWWFGVHRAVGCVHQRAESLGVRFGSGGSAQGTHVLAQVRAHHGSGAVFQVVWGETRLRSLRLCCRSCRTYSRVGCCSCSCRVPGLFLRRSGCRALAPGRLGDSGSAAAAGGVISRGWLLSSPLHGSDQVRQTHVILPELKVVISLHRSMRR